MTRAIFKGFKGLGVDNTILRTYCILDSPIDEYKATDEERAKGMKLYDTYFELYDDDDILYFKGRYNSVAIDAEIEINQWGDIWDEFSILDYFMGGYGCTYMKVRNKKTKRMEHL